MSHILDKSSAQAALRLLHGYRLLDKPLVIEFGRAKNDCNKDRKMEDSEKSSKVQARVNNLDKKEVVIPDISIWLREEQTYFVCSVYGMLKI